MATRSILLSLSLIASLEVQASDSLKITVIGIERATLFISVDCIDPEFYSLDEDQVRDGRFNLPSDCYLDLKSVSFHLRHNDSIPASIVYSHWFGYKKGEFKRSLRNKRILQLPVGYLYNLDSGSYTLYVAYYSRRFGRCIKSNIIEFEVK